MAGLIGAALAWQGLSAMTSVPTDFERQVRVAEQIVLAEVVATTPEWVESPNGRLIRTVVEVRVRERLKGSGPETLKLQFMGGKIGPRELTIPGMPKFQPGTAEFLFIAENGRAVCPLVGLHAGRLPVVQRDGAAYVFRHDGEPLRDVAELSRVGDSQRPPQPGATGLKQEEFIRAIRERLAAQGK